jgi:hypothetical protein
LNLVFVEKWILLIKVVTELVIKDILHGSTIKGKNRDNISSIKLKETLVEHRWVTLSFHKVENVRLCVTDVETLE